MQSVGKAFLNLIAGNGRGLPQFSIAHLRILA